MDSYRRSAHLALGKLKLRIISRDFLVTVAIMAVASLVAFFVRPWKGEVTGALIFMLGITISGAVCGLAAALTAALAAFFLYNFYFAEPVLTFRIENGADVAPLIVFNLCAIITGVLAGRLKDYAEAADKSNSQLASLLETSRALQVAVRLKDIQAVLSQAPSSSIEVLIKELDTPLPWQGLVEPLTETRFPLALPDGSAVYRLDGSAGPVGVMIVRSGGHNLPDPAFMTAFTNVVALAVERARLLEEITESRAAARTEELKSALLASVSHDFRTPLTTISASASSLVEYRDRLDDETALRLLRGIVDECERLNRYTANLLELSRLETGLIPAHFQTLSVSDVINSVIQRSRSRLGNRKIIRKFRHADLLIDADTALFELVLLNIFDNAIIYSEDHTKIMVECERDGDDCLIAIADEGRGIAAHELARVFERFYRTAGLDHSPRGSGLGLAIVKGFVGALGGSVSAATPGIEERGTRIIIRIPSTSDPVTL